MLPVLLAAAAIPTTYFLSYLTHTHHHNTDTDHSSSPVNECTESCERIATVHPHTKQVNIPQHAPTWVHDLPSNGMQYVDRTALYDIRGHLLFDSLLSTNGIRHFLYFMDAEHASRAEYAFSRTARGANSHLGFSHDELSAQLKDGTGPDVRVAFHLGDNVCGHKQIVHGGLTATIIDEVSGASAFAAVGPCFTANLNVNYLKPLPAGRWVLVKSHVHKQEGRKAWVTTTVEDGEGNAFAKGEALFIRPRVDVHEHSKQQNAAKQK